ncbi:MAG: radical SAM protein [bacterium]
MKKRRKKKEGGVVPVSTEYGCDGHCTFCGTAAMLKKSYDGSCCVSCRDVEDIIQELKMLKAQGVRVVFFTTATFNRRPERLSEICEAIIAAGLHSSLPETHPDHIKNSLHFYAYVKVGLTKKQAELMARAGFTVLAVGIESMDEEIVRGFNKPYSGFQAVVDHLRNVDDAGMLNRGLIIFPTSYDSPETKMRLIKRLKIALPDCLRLAHLCPHPGTPEGDRLRKAGLVAVEDYDKYDHNHQVVRLPHFSPEEAERAQHDIYKGYYLSPEYQKHVLIKIERFPWLKKSFIEFFAGLCRQKGD